MNLAHPPIAMLTDQQIAQIFVRLEVPLAVQDLLSASAAPLSDADHLALHDMLSRQTPDQALLSVALGALVIESHLRAAGQRCAEILAMSAEMMIQDYGPIYLEQQARHRDSTLFDRADLDLLEVIPEDLESISDLLAVVADVLPDTAGRVRELILILSHQARAQALIAETLVEAFAGTDPLEVEETLVQNVSKEGESNVVPFRRKETD